MNEFLKELSDLTRKHNIKLVGSGVYYGFGFVKEEFKADDDGFYQITPENDDCIEWIHTI